MKLMDLVLYNRLRHNPNQFNAKNAKTIVEIIKAPGQFAGFEAYPHYDAGIVNNLQLMVDIANNHRDHRNKSFAAFIKLAINVANSTETIPDPAPGDNSFLAFWRTAGSSGPGGSSVLFKTVGGNDFYYMP